MGEAQQTRARRNARSNYATMMKELWADDPEAAEVIRAHVHHLTEETKKWRHLAQELKGQVNG